MSRETLHDNSAFNFWFMSGQFGSTRLEESTLYTLDADSHLSQYVDAAAPGTAIRLPPVSEGKFFVITNTGTEDLDVQNANGLSLFTLPSGESNIFHSEGADWYKLFVPVSSISVFGGEGPGASDGLVPSPGAAQPGLRFLGSDAAWHTVTDEGILDGFAFITDGTNTANASGADTFRIRSSSGKITITVTNDEAVFGDNVNLSVNEAAVDHNSLLNYVADQHVAHSGVQIATAAGSGLQGGGTIAATRNLSVDFFGLTTLASPTTLDWVVVYDDTPGAPGKIRFGNIAPVINHNALNNYVANEHINHTSVTFSVGTGLTGGGDISASRTISLDFSGLPTQAESMASGDLFPFYDVSGSVHKKISWGSINSALDHNALTNYVANQHIDHTAVTLTAGNGLTGGGNIAANRSFAIDAAATSDVLTGTSTSKVATPDAIAALWEKGADVASSGTISLGEGGFFHITGTTTITDIDFATPKDGRWAMVVFDGILTLTHNATTLKLPNNGANITTAAGDRACFTQDSGDNVVCLWYQKADGTPLQGGGGGVSDGDKGDIVVSSSGTVWLFDSSVVTAAAKTVLDDATVGDMRTTLQVPHLGSANTFTADQTISSSDAGASAGPILDLFRNSASPAPSDVLGRLNYSGKSSTGVTRNYANIETRIISETNAAESGRIHFRTIQAGTEDTRWLVQAGLFSQNVTGSDKGVDTINTISYYKDGYILQPIVQQVNTQTGAVATGTTTIPLDDTIPQITEGTEFMTLAITPKNANNKLKIEVVFNGAFSVATTLIMALFQDATANALATVATGETSFNSLHRQLILSHYMTAGTTSATTFRVRAGGTTASTITFNGVGGARRFGGVMSSSITITEIAA